MKGQQLKLARTRGGCLQLLLLHHDTTTAAAAAVCQVSDSKLFGATSLEKEVKVSCVEGREREGERVCDN